MRLVGLFLVAAFLSFFAVPQAALAWDGYVVRVEDSNCIAVADEPNSKEVRARLFFYGIQAPTGKQPMAAQAMASFPAAKSRERNTPMESSAPARISSSSAFSLTQPPVRSRNSTGVTKAPSFRRESRITRQTFFFRPRTAQRPNRIASPSAAKERSPAFTSGGRSAIPCFRHSSGRDEKSPEVTKSRRARKPYRFSGITSSQYESGNRVTKRRFHKVQHCKKIILPYTKIS